MWTVILSRDGIVEQREEFDRYFHAQMLADNLILGNDSRFGAANLPSFKDGEKYDKNGIVIMVSGVDYMPSIEKSGFISWVENRTQKGKWSVDG